ncbi:hypothetical protein [Methanopyrus sp.]
MDLTHLRATLAYVMTEFGINVGINSEVLNEILRITNGNVTFIVDESADDLAGEGEDYTMSGDLSELVGEFQDLTGFLTELIAVVPHELLNENPEVVDALTTIVLVDDVKDVTEISTNVPVLVLDEREVIYIHKDDVITIDLYDLQYVKSLSSWIGFRDIFEHKYYFDKDRALRVLSIINNSERPSIEAISELTNQPRFGVLMDIFIVERMKGTIVRDKPKDVINDLKGVSISVRDTLPADEVVDVLAGETTLSKREVADVVYTLLTDTREFTPAEELERRTAIGANEIRRVLSALTRIKALSFQFDVEAPLIY